MEIESIIEAGLVVYQKGGKLVKIMRLRVFFEKITSCPAS